MTFPAFAPSELILNPDQSVYHLHLQKAHLCDTIIAVGDPERVGEVSRHFQNITHRIQKREFVTHIGTYKGERLMVISSGIGTDNIDILMNELDALANIDFEKRQVRPDVRSFRLIRIGTSGTIQPNIPVGSFLASQRAVGLDALGSFYQMPQSEQEKQMLEALQKQIALPFLPYTAQADSALIDKVGFDMIRGTTLTACGFYAPQGRVLRCTPAMPNLIEKLAAFRYDLGAESLRLTNLEMETAGYYAFGKILGHQVLSLNAILANRQTGEFASNPQMYVEGLIEQTLSRLFS
ncbi:nucleoside phosphorylase [Hugenholtzia roseola]|uniref:nucleoside phosphorylase n=1 Tax=Hugenholtzia roseola TaxID=1002 RepID=UPI00041344AF|nr:nucleoside phosphorylase [Hugenholtzia roseola]